jgi:hypothetical protein
MTTESVQNPFIVGTIITNAGENDPSFDLTDPNDIQTIQQMLNNLNPASAPDWPQFGFRGYGLENQGIASFPPYLRVFQGVIQIFNDVGSDFYQDINGLENFLSEIANSTTSPSTANQILVKRDAPAKLPTSGSEPPYEPGKWNKAPVIDNNNCYSYATNIIGDTFPRPGRAGGKQPPFPGEAGYNCDSFIAAAVSDGLVKVDCAKACPKGSYKVALVINPNTDYHWYRQDDNGNWSHKPGSSEATNLDNSKKPITDPQTADRGPYTTFCGCLCVPPKTVKIRDVLLYSLADVNAALDVYGVDD